MEFPIEEKSDMSKKSALGPMDSAHEPISAQLFWLRVSMVLVPLLGSPLLVIYILASNRSKQCDLAPELAKVVARSGAGWTNAVIDGSIDFFGKTVIGIDVIYALSCVLSLGNYYGWEVTAPFPVTPANLARCIAAGAALIFLNWGSLVLLTNSASEGWVCGGL